MRDLQDRSQPSIEWVILTPEFVPAPGGVADYSLVLARALALAGDSVSVWFPGPTKQDQCMDNLKLKSLEAGFGFRGLGSLRRDLEDLPRRARVLLQYVPHAFGYKGMNLPIIRTLSNCTRNPLDIMFHEVAYPRIRRDPVRHQVLSAIQFEMARQISRSADRVFVATEAWRPLIANWVRDRASIVWLPVPSNLPTSVRAENTALARVRLGKNRNVVLGHFSTYAPGITSFLSATIPSLLVADSSRVCALMGKGSQNFRLALSSANPGLASQLLSFEGEPVIELAGLISACDLILQPYPDGVTSRRTTVMASIALGIPTVTTTGALTEAIWGESGGVALSPAHSIDAFVASVEEILRDPVGRAQLGLNGQKLYNSAFDVSHTVRRLRQVD